MTLTASVLYDLVQCPQRVALDAFGKAAERDAINPFVRLLWERGTLFERETIAKLQFPFLDLSAGTGAHASPVPQSPHPYDPRSRPLEVSRGHGAGSSL
jgi:hypothetical protein